MGGDIRAPQSVTTETQGGGDQGDTMLAERRGDALLIVKLHGDGAGSFVRIGGHRVGQV